MTYKNKLIFLLSIISALILIYTAGIIFNPERSNAMSASYIWFDKKLADNINRVTILSEEQNIEFINRNNQWFVRQNGTEYPARKLRIEDFIGNFTTRSAWNVRSSNASSHSRFGLAAQDAVRLTIYGENTALIDLLFGNTDASGQEIFVRKYGENEVRSGENKISSYLTGSVKYWYNLRLFAEGEDDIENVQRLSVYDNGENQIFSRNNRTWTVSGINVENPDYGSIESYIRIVLNSEGDDFMDDAFLHDIDFNYSRIVAEFGNGKVTTIRLSAPDENNRRYAMVDGNKYIYSIPSWVSDRLFKDVQNFEMQ